MTTFTEETGNLLEADADALVNTVNTVGVMGKGIALQFKNAFPANYQAYRHACEEEAIRLGEMFVFETGVLGRPRWIINFPTKQHWRARSKLHHIAPPTGAPAAGEMVVATERPVLTPGKAALVAMVDRYTAVALSTSLIEIQKLMYFLQESGKDLRLRYKDHYFGPYADNLRHVLNALEGHHLRGFGDGSNPVAHAEPIDVLSGAIEEASSVLAENPDITNRMNRVLELVEGYESPVGLELLATVHWVATHIEWAPHDAPKKVVEQVQARSPRKRRLFAPEHITAAYERLRQQGWLDQIAPPV